jgi:hypothetical protein
LIGDAHRRTFAERQVKKEQKPSEMKRFLGKHHWKFMRVGAQLMENAERAQRRQNALAKDPEYVRRKAYEKMTSVEAGWRQARWAAGAEFSSVRCNAAVEAEAHLDTAKQQRYEWLETTAARRSLELGATSLPRATMPSIVGDGPASFRGIVPDARGDPGRASVRASILSDGPGDRRASFRASIPDGRGEGRVSFRAG